MNYTWNHFHKVLQMLNYIQVEPPHGEDGFLYYESDNRSRITIQKSNDYPDEYVEILLSRMDLKRNTFERMIRGSTI
jgi:hypothetical protein